MPFFCLLFFFLKEKHTPRQRWYLSFSSICPFFVLLWLFFFLLFSFMLFGSWRNLSLPKCNLSRSFYGTKIYDTWYRRGNKLLLTVVELSYDCIVWFDFDFVFAKYKPKNFLTQNRTKIIKKETKQVD